MSGEIFVGHGRCVNDGPFANLEVRHYDGDYHPHCLSRGFLEDELLVRFGHSRTQPEAIEKAMNEADYFNFLSELEDGPHAAIAKCVRGDFSKVTAPNGMYPIKTRGESGCPLWNWLL